MKPTEEQGKALHKIFQYFNKTLFEGKLPDVMLVLSRNKNIIGGYHSKEQWANDDGDLLTEIGLNANVVAEGNSVQTLAILIHEMAHHWQYSFGNPSRPGYHNTEWAKKCIDMGLQPICCDPGAAPGTITGQKMNTKLIPGGKAERVIAEMNEDLNFPFYANNQIIIDDDGEAVPMPTIEGVPPGEHPQLPSPPPVPDQPHKPVTSGSRTKYTCPICGLNAWAKYNASLICGECNTVMIGQV